MNSPFNPSRTQSYKDAQGQWDDVIVEAPLQINVHDLELSNIRTPGDDENLVRGFLLSEGFVTQAHSIEKIQLKYQLGLDSDDGSDIANVTLNTPFSKTRHERALEIRPSCGVCGENSFNTFAVSHAPLQKNCIEKSTLLESVSTTKNSQELFNKTGACHAAALFSFDGRLIHLGEDVGRHNAVDKVIGHAASDKVNFNEVFLFLSGRCGIELISKAARVGIPVIASVSGTTSMSIELAKKAQITLLCFCRGTSARVYNDPGRLS